VRLAAILALGVPAGGVLVFELVFGVANLVEHANLELPRRAELLARRVLITPSLHRAHHVADWRELNTNFGTVLSAWDRACGTFRASEPGRHVATGLPGGSSASGRSLGAALRLPFVPRAGS
jgi:sterol desaturase/sphingolipid hydroxylase (fatty acid hydroxylase superfamily)